MFVLLLLPLLLATLAGHAQIPILPDLWKLMLPKVDSLKPVIVRPTGLRPRMKGDTVEYNTGSIRLRPNALVEEMLGRLPGLQISSDGTITYNGEKIQKLLVDGEDLFGSDPTIVTRNFDASKIAKVQILDRKSDQANFTGIDDGSRTRTLNLVMKEESKNSYFGRIEAGADPEGTYNANGLLASFRRREQFAVLGFASNTGILGFSSSVGGTTTSITGSNRTADPLGASAGTGIPRFIASALHYANTWNGPEDHALGNYQYSHLFTQPLTTTYTIQTLPDSIYTQRLYSRSVNQQDQHLGYGGYDYAPDSVSALNFTFYGIATSAHNQYSDSGFSSFNGIAVNSSQRTIQDEVSDQNMGGSAAWRIRARRQTDRALSITAGLISNNNSTNGYLYSLNRYYQPNGSVQSVDTVDQRKQISNQSLDLSGSLNYTEPLWKKAVLGISYVLIYTRDQSLQATFGKENGKYLEYIDSLSSHYREQTLNQQGLINLQGSGPHFSYTIASGIQLYSYHQQGIQTGAPLKYQNIAFIPHVLVSYTPDPVTHFDFNYGSSTQQPSVTQLQPVINNSDPLHITLGNPNLRPGFVQEWRLNFSHLKTTMINLNLILGSTSNGISTRTLTDSLGRQTSQPLNVDGGRNAALNFSINRRIGGLDAEFHSNINYSRTVNYVNTDLSRNDSYTEGGGFTIARYVVDQYSIQLYTQFTYFDTHSSINTTAPVRYWTQNHSGSLTLFFFRGFEINTNAVYTWQQATSAFAKSTSVLLWNAGASRNFLTNRLVLKFQVNNLLNQNAGIGRSNVNNLNTETSTNILGRYWLLTLAYHFDHLRKNK